MSDGDGSAGDFEHGHGSGIGGILRGRLLKMSQSRPFIIYMGSAILVMAVYFGLIATPIYVSNASFTIRGAPPPSIGSANAATASLTAVTGGTESPTDALSEPASIIDYVQSPQVMEILDRRYHLREMYSHPRADLFHWIPRNAKQEDYLTFYRRMVKPTFDVNDLIMRLQVRSFSSQSAHDIAEGVLDLSNTYVDNLSARIRADTMKTAEAEVEKAERQVQSTRLALAQFRGANGVVDPTSTASVQTGAISTLQQALNAAKAQRSSLAAYSTAKAPLMQQADSRIANLQKQLDAAQATLASKGQEDTVAQKLYGYAGLQAAGQYAELALTSALQNYDTARLSANQQTRFLVRAVNPNYPDSAEEPHRLLGFILGVIAALALYAAVILTIAGVRDFKGR